MKHSLKISSLIIFAATVASAFTSCGNESELFEEPVMYQTRAMTRAGMGGEFDQQKFVIEGESEESDAIALGNEGNIFVTLSWRGGQLISNTKIEAKGRVICSDSTYTHHQLNVKEYFFKGDVYPTVRFDVDLYYSNKHFKTYYNLEFESKTIVKTE